MGKQMYTTVRNFDMAMKDIISDYLEDSEQKVKEATLDVAKACRKDVRQRARAQQGKAKHGVSWSDYIKGWNYKQAKLPKYMGGAYVYHVYNKDKAGLAHLLEFGHSVSNAYGDNLGKAGAYPHVIPAEVSAKKKLMEEVEGAFR